jgi:hypothetical protein
MLSLLLYRVPTQHTAASHGVLQVGVTCTILYAAGHTRIHLHLELIAHLTLEIVQIYVTLPHQAAFAQTSHILETAMGGGGQESTVIYIITLCPATQTLDMTVGGSRSVLVIVATKLDQSSLIRRESFRPLWFLAPL